MSEKVNKLICYVSAIALMLGLLSLPFGYYTLLRIIVCIAAGYIVYREYSFKGVWNNWVLIFSLIALLFNPLFVIFLSRSLWFFIDIFCAGLFVAHFKISQKEKVTL